MHITSTHTGGSVLASLRALAPNHSMTLDEALRLAERYVSESKARFGDASVEHATALDSLAQTYFAQSHFDEAEPIYQRVLAIREKALGPHHEDVLSTLAMVGTLRGSGPFSRGTPNEALLLLHRFSPDA